jgi:prevent-host-death family protein
MVIDYGHIASSFTAMTAKPTETMAISEFKATCLAVLERVRRTGTSIVITKRGEPVAEVNPPSPASTGEGWLGSMRGTATLADDLIAPASVTNDWDAFGA